MEPDSHPREVLLSRKLSEYSVEESRPGFFNSSYIDNITYHREPDSSSSRKESASSSKSKSRNTTNQIPVVIPSLGKDVNPSTCSIPSAAAMTSWTDPLAPGDPSKPQELAPKKNRNGEIVEELGSATNQPLKEGSKSGVFLGSHMEPSATEEHDLVTKFQFRVKKSILESFTPKVFRSFIQCLSAFVIISLLLIIPSTARWMGPVGLLSCYGLIFFPPNKTVGAQLEASVLGVIFIIISGIYSYAGLACLVAYNSRENHQPFGASLITASFIIFSTLLLVYLRTSYFRLYTPCMAAQITLLFTLFLNMRITELELSHVWIVSKPLLLAIAISFTCSLVIFPQSATEKLAYETQHVLDLTNTFLEVVVETFLYTEDDTGSLEALETTQLSLRSSLGLLNSAGKEAVYELSIDRFSPRDYKWIGSTLTAVGEILGSMLLLVFKEYSVLSRDSDAPHSYHFNRNESSVIQIEHNRDLRVSDTEVHMALLNTIRDPVTKVTEVCGRTIKHIQSQLRSKKNISQGSNGNMRANLTNNFETSKIIEELENTITDFETTEVLCSHVLQEMGLDTKPRDELFMVFTFLFCTREVARILLKLAKFQENLCRLRVKGKRVWWPAMGLRTLLGARGYVDLPQVPEKEVEVEVEVETETDADANKQADRIPYHIAKTQRHFRYHLWQFLMWFRRPEFKFSVKFALALCLTATPALAPSTYDWFLQVHGNWGLVTVCFVLNQTVGSTLSISIYRIIGTILGGFWGYLGWIASRGNPYIVAVFTYIIGVPCWFFFVTRPQTKIHSVSIITYVVIMFSIYYTEVIQGEKSPNSAFVLAVLRTVNIIAAIVISLLVETLLWPYIARVELRKHLSATIYNLGILFSRIMSVYMMNGDTPAALEAKHEAKRLTKKLQSAMTKATVLLGQSAKEPRLRDRFQEQVYADIIIKAQNLLDWSSTMYASIIQTDDALRVRLAKRLARRRKDVVATALLHFYVLSGALKSKSPLPPYLPSARVARLRLLNQIREIDIFQDLGSRAHAIEFVYTFWYSYTGSLIEIVEEQEELGDLIKQVVGEIEFADWDLDPHSDEAQATSIDLGGS